MERYGLPETRLSCDFNFKMNADIILMHLTVVIYLTSLHFQLQYILVNLRRPRQQREMFKQLVEISGDRFLITLYRMQEMHQTRRARHPQFRQVFNNILPVFYSTLRENTDTTLRMCLPLSQFLLPHFITSLMPPRTILFRRYS